MNFLASPPLVVAYALAGTLDIDLRTSRSAPGTDGKPVFSPTSGRRDKEVADAVHAHDRLGDVPQQLRQRVQGRRPLAGHQGAGRQDLRVGREVHLREEPALLRRHDDDAAAASATITGARVLALLGDSVTTDHISPAGNIAKTSPAAKYLVSQGVQPVDFNSVRRAPRQPRSDDARHVRQHPPAQPAAAGHRRRRHRPRAERRADVASSTPPCATSRKARRW